MIHFLFSHNTMIMEQVKRLIVIVFLGSLALNALATENSTESDSLSVAERYYASQDYESAIRIYEEILAEGLESTSLYFNLANAYFKNGNVAKSILNYERALLRSPGDEAVTENLEIAKSYQVDKIEVIPEFALSVWFRSFASIMHSDAWAILSVAFFMLLLVTLFLYLFASSLVLKKTGFFSALLLLLLFLSATGLARYQKNRIEGNVFAVVLTPSVTVKSAPDASGTDLLVIHEGMKVQTADVVGDWIEIILTDGSVGWILKNDLELI